MKVPSVAGSEGSSSESARKRLRRPSDNQLGSAIDTLERSSRSAHEAYIAQAVADAEDSQVTMLANLLKEGLLSAKKPAADTSAKPISNCYTKWKHLGVKLLRHLLSVMDTRFYLHSSTDEFGVLTQGAAVKLILYGLGLHADADLPDEFEEGVVKFAKTRYLMLGKRFENEIHDPRWETMGYYRLKYDQVQQKWYVVCVVFPEAFSQAPLPFAPPAQAEVSLEKNWSLDVLLNVLVLGIRHFEVKTAYKLHYGDPVANHSCMKDLPKSNAEVLKSVTVENPFATPEKKQTWAPVVSPESAASSQSERMQQQLQQQEAAIPPAEGADLPGDVADNHEVPAGDGAASFMAPPF